MIKWPELKIPAINLWNCPRQEELEQINLMRAEVVGCRVEAAVNMFMAEILAAQIKEREFLYYLHSGRFPD